MSCSASPHFSNSWLCGSPAKRSVSALKYCIFQGIFSCRSAQMIRRAFTLRPTVVIVLTRTIPIIFMIIRIVVIVPGPCLCLGSFLSPTARQSLKASMNAGTRPQSPNTKTDESLNPKPLTLSPKPSTLHPKP